MKAALAVFACLALAVSASAQVVGPGVGGGQGPVDLPPDTPRDQPRGTSGGFGGVGISIKLGGKKKKPKKARMPDAPPMEMRDEPMPDAVAGQLIAVSATDADAERIARGARLTLIEAVPLEALGKTMLVLALPTGESEALASQRLSAQRGVEWVQPNHMFQSLGKDLPRRFTLVGITRPAQLRVTGTVAMIDTPVDVSHPLLRAAGVTQTIHGSSPVPAAHGTAIASLLVGTGEVAGMAQGAQLASFAAFDTGAAQAGFSQTRYIAKALNAAWQARPDVLNLSFGGRQDRLLGDLLNAIDRRGTCVAAAAGNGGPQSAVLFPARHPTVLAVTAADDSLRGYAHAARGPEIDVTGIGVGLLASVPGGYRQVSGTSFATAAVSGALLRLGACNAAHNPAAMRRDVASTVQDLGAPGPDVVFGAGLMRLGGGKAKKRK